MHRHENLTTQVDGIKDTFTVSKSYLPGTLTLTYNGQTFPPGVNILVELTPKSFRLAFVPDTETSFLSVSFEESGGGIINGQTIRGSGLPPF